MDDDADRPEHTMIMREAPVRPGSAPDVTPSSRGGAMQGRNPYDVLPSLDAPFSPPPPVVAHVTAPTPAPSARHGQSPRGTTPPPPAAQSGGYGAYPFQSPQPPQVQPRHPQMPLPPGVAPAPRPSARPPADPHAAHAIPQTMRPVSAFPSSMRRSSRPPPNLPLPSTFLPPQQQAPGSFMIPALLLGGPLLLAMLVIAVLALG